MNETNELYGDILIVHTVVRSVFHKVKKVMAY